MLVRVQITVAGANTGPMFNIFSDVGPTLVAANVPKIALLAPNYMEYTVPDGTTIITLVNTGGVCPSVQLLVSTTTSTTTVAPTTTTTTTSTPTTTTTTTEVELYTRWKFVGAGEPLIPAPGDCDALCEFLYLYADPAYTAMTIPLFYEDSSLLTPYVPIATDVFAYTDGGTTAKYTANISQIDGTVNGWWECPTTTTTTTASP